MKFKKIMLVTFLLLAVLTIGAVSASDNATLDDDLAASDVAESPIDEVSADEVIVGDSNNPTAEDFNLQINNGTNIEDSNSYAVTFSTPAYANGMLEFYVNDSNTNGYLANGESNAGQTTNVPAKSIFRSPGTYILLVKYVPDSGSETLLANTTVTVLKEYTIDQFDTFSRDAITSESYAIFSLYKIPDAGTLLIYVDDELRVNQTYSSKSPYKQFYVSDLDITENGDFRVKAKFLVESSGQEFTLNEWDITVNCLPVSIFLTTISIDMDYQFSSPSLGSVYDDYGIRGTIQAFLDGKEVFNKQYTASDDKYSVKLEDFTYYDGFELGNHTVKIVYTKGSKEYTKEGVIGFYADPNVVNPYSLTEGQKKYITVNYHKKSTGTLVVYNTVKDSTVSVGWKKTTAFMTFNLNGNGTVSIPLESLSAGYYGFCLNITLGTYSVEKYMDVQVQEVQDTRTPVDFDIEVNNITFGDDAVIKVTASSTAFSGIVALDIDGIAANVTLTNGVGTVNVPNLNAAYNYFVQASSEANDQFKAGYGTASFTVSKAWSDILFNEEIINMAYGFPTNLTIATEGATGMVAEIDGQNLTVEGDLIMIPVLSVGTHTLTITTLVDSNHIEDSRQTTLNVTQVKSRIICENAFMEFLSNESGIIALSVVDGTIGNVSVLQHPEAIIAVGENKITISNLAPGEYNLSVTSNPDYPFAPSSLLIPIKVYDESLSFIAPAVTFDYGGSGTCQITGTSKIVEYYIEGGIGKVTCEGNVITVSGLDAGTYTLVIKALLPPERGVTQNTTVTVNKVDSSVNPQNVVLEYGSTSKIIVNTVGATGFTATIDGNAATVDGNTVTASGLGVGNHTLLIATNPDANHNPVSVNVTVTVNKATTKITAAAVSTTYGTAKSVTVTLKDKNGAAVANREVTIKVNGKLYKGTTNSKGQVAIAAVPKTLAVKSYTATLSFAGDDTYLKSTGTVKVTVKKATPKLTAKAAAFKRTVKTKKYSVTLKTDKGAALKNAKVTVKVNKVTYSAKTNAKGVAVVKITKLTKKGKYSAAVKFAGNSYYNAVSKSVKITVK